MPYDNFHRNEPFGYSFGYTNAAWSCDNMWYDSVDDLTYMIHKHEVYPGTNFKPLMSTYHHPTDQIIFPFTVSDETVDRHQKGNVFLDSTGRVHISWLGTASQNAYQVSTSARTLAFDTTNDLSGGSYNRFQIDGSQNVFHCHCQPSSSVLQFRRSTASRLRTDVDDWESFQNVCIFNSNFVYGVGTLGPDGRLHWPWTEVVSGDYSDIFYMVCPDPINSPTAWETAGGTAISPFPCTDASNMDKVDDSNHVFTGTMDFDTSDNAYFTYLKDTATPLSQSDLYIAWYDSGWNTQQVASSIDAFIHHHRLIIDGSDDVYIYAIGYDGSNYNLYELKSSTSDLTSWTTTILHQATSLGTANTESPSRSIKSGVVEVSYSQGSTGQNVTNRAWYYNSNLADSAIGEADTWDDYTSGVRSNADYPVICGGGMLGYRSGRSAYEGYRRRDVTMPSAKWGLKFQYHHVEGEADGIEGLMISTDEEAYEFCVNGFTGTDDSGVDNKATSMTDLGTNLITQGGAVGSVIYNTDDPGSSGVITSFSKTGAFSNDTANFSAGLSGGSKNEFDDGDGYKILSSTDALIVKVEGGNPYAPKIRLVVKDGQSESTSRAITIADDTSYFCILKYDGETWAKLSVCTDIAGKVHAVGSPVRLDISGFSNGALSHTTLSNYADGSDATAIIDGYFRDMAWMKA